MTDEPTKIDWLRKPPEAVIERTGRWMHLIYITHGVMRYGPDGYGWHVVGAGRAERKARRELASYIERQKPCEKRTVRMEDVMTDDEGFDLDYDFVTPADLGEHDVRFDKVFSDEQLSKRDAAIEARVRAEVAAEPMRVIAVVNWHTGRVHGVTCDQEQAQEWVREIGNRYDDDHLAASMTVDLVMPGGRQVPWPAGSSRDTTPEGSDG